MTTALLLLASILPTGGAVPTSTEMHQATLAELFTVSWSGTWTCEGQTDPGVTVHKGVFMMPMNPQATMRLEITAQGRGWFRGRLGAARLPIVSIWKCERDRLVLCSNEAQRGFQRHFEGG